MYIQNSKVFWSYVERYVTLYSLVLCIFKVFHYFLQYLVFLTNATMSYQKLLHCG